MVGRDEISTCPAGADFILQLHGEIKFHPGKGQFSVWYFLKFSAWYFSLIFLFKNIN